MNAIYLHDWADEKFIGMVGDFEDIYMSSAEYEAEEAPYANADYWENQKAAMKSVLSKDQWQGVEVLLASYTYQNYEGDAFVLFRKNGQLFEVNGGHCSCHGLEGQWKPEETSVEALEHRLHNGSLGSSDYSGNIFADELRGVLAALKTGR